MYIIYILDQSVNYWNNVIHVCYLEQNVCHKNNSCTPVSISQCRSHVLL